MVTRERAQSASAEQQLKELGIKLPAPPEPFGAYVEAVQTGNLLFLSGMLPTEGHGAKFIGRVGAQLDVEAGRKAAHLAALNVLAVALDPCKRRWPIFPPAFARFSSSRQSGFCCCLCCDLHLPVISVNGHMKVKENDRSS